MPGTVTAKSHRARPQAWLFFVPAIGWLWLASLLFAALLGYDVRRHHFESAGIAFGVGAALFAIAGVRHRPSDPVQSHGLAMAIGVSAAVALGAFAWTLSLGPLSDDFVLQRWAMAGEWIPEGWPHVRPLPLALWRVVFASGGDWTALHLLNVVVHALNAGLVAALASGWLGPRPGLVAGVTFALFPASTEAVAWSAGIFDVLATLCVLCATLVWVRWAPSARQAVALLCCSLAGLFTKEIALAIPFLLALTTLIGPTGSSPQWRRRMSALAVTVVVTGGYLVWRAFLSPAVVQHLDALPADRREWKDLLVRPFAALAVPIRTETGLPLEAYLVGLALLVLCALLLVGIRASRSELDHPVPSSQSAVLLVGLGWVILTTLPLLGQFYVSATLQGGRYLYLPAVGFAIVLAAALVGPARRSAVGGVAFLLLLGLYVGVLRHERTVWRQAAALRDAVLTRAAGVIQASGCRSLDVTDAPESFQGAFVFREGLTEALSGLEYVGTGVPCHLQWDGPGTLLAYDPAARGQSIDPTAAPRMHSGHTCIASASHQSRRSPRCRQGSATSYGTCSAPGRSNWLIRGRRSRPPT